MSNATAITESTVKQLVDTWFAKLDVHAPLEELLPMIAPNELEMHLPEGILHGAEGFTGWYDTVTHKFFDEVHTMKKLDIQVSSDHADVQLVVNWQAHIWNAPDAKSQWLGFDAIQRWTLKYREASQRLVITLYIVDALNPMPGSISL